MRLIDQLRSVRHTFASNRGRVALTLLGIMIGSSSIVLLASLVEGGQEALVSTNQWANEADLIRVDKDTPPPQQATKSARELGRGDAALLDGATSLPNAQVAMQKQKWDARADYKGKHKRVSLVSGTPESFGLYRLQIEHGRFLDAGDLANGGHVCVIGINVWQELLESNPKLEELELIVDGKPWQVVGVLKNKPPLNGATQGQWLWNNKVIVPRTTFDATFNNTHQVDAVFVRIGLSNDLEQRKVGARATIKGSILRRHFGVENFKVDRRGDENQQEQLILVIIKVLLLGTGLLSLFVGGINIMNIMLVTVTERTREIGVRRALGANPTSILTQFVLEAGFIATVGGLIGVLGGVGLSWGIAALFTRMMGSWALHVEAWSIALGLALSLITGVVFGFMPAWRASRLDPVEALRYE